MNITLYNTCPPEYDKKFSQILKKIIGPAIRAGRSVKVDEISESKKHEIRCDMLNSKKRISSMNKCMTCLPRTGHEKYISSTMAKISIT